MAMLESELAFFAGDQDAVLTAVEKCLAEFLPRNECIDDVAPLLAGHVSQSEMLAEPNDGLDALGIRRIIEVAFGQDYELFFFYFYHLNFLPN
jgi:hypothetical protein